MAPLRPSPREQPTLCRRMPPPNVGATLVSPERPSQRRGRASRNVGATLVSPERPSQHRNWPETSRTPHRAMPRTGCAVPAPGVINGAPTSITARRPTQRRGMPPPNVGATLVSPGKPPQRRNWPETSRTLPRTMPRTGRAVPAPGVINGAPTSITARRPSQRRNWPASPRAGPRQMRQRARSKLLVTTDTDEKAMHAADTPGVSISPHTGKSAPAARGMPTAL